MLQHTTAVNITSLPLLKQPILGPYKGNITSRVDSYEQLSHTAQATRTSRGENLSWAVCRIIFTFPNTVGGWKPQGVLSGPSWPAGIIPIAALIYAGAAARRSEEPWCSLLFVSRGAQQLLTIDCSRYVSPHQLYVTKVRCKAIMIHPWQCLLNCSVLG